MKTPLFAALLLAGAALASAARADCGQFIHHDQGGDYTNGVDREGLEVVEKFHFTPQVEQLVAGVSDTLGGDIGYTLEHFPNHHRALAAMAKLGLRDKTEKPQGAKYTIQCYFDRAMRYAPADARVRSIFGGYLLALGQTDPALEQLREAARLEPDNATNHYNLGLLYLRKRDYVQSRAEAEQAYAQGFPLQGLKNKLKAAGQWTAGQ